MDHTESQVQKYFVAFCKSLPTHVACWRSVLQESVKSLRSLTNLCEQQRHIKRTTLDNFQDFEDAQATLLYQISNRIEEELINLKELIDKLSKSNNDLKNKLQTLERATLNLQWNSKSELIKGNGSQPGLSRLLQDGLAFLIFFSENGRNISDRFKILDLDDEASVKDLQSSFDIDLNVDVIVGLIALSQYVDNEKAIS